VGSLETPIPFQGGLENQYLSKSSFENHLKELLNY
jgi:hypothetical protein